MRKFFDFLREVRNNPARSPDIGDRAGWMKVFGGVLLSHTASHAVPSALKSLTSVFGMGTGVASSPSPPKNRIYRSVQFGLSNRFLLFMSVILWPSRTTD